MHLSLGFYLSQTFYLIVNLSYKAKSHASTALLKAITSL